MKQVLTDWLLYCQDFHKVLLTTVPIMSCSNNKLTQIQYWEPSLHAHHFNDHFPYKPRLCCCSLDSHAQVILILRSSWDRPKLFVLDTIPPGLSRVFPQAPLTSLLVLVTIISILKFLNRFILPPINYQGDRFQCQ